MLIKEFLAILLAFGALAWFLMSTVTFVGPVSERAIRLSTVVIKKSGVETYWLGIFTSCEKQAGQTICVMKFFPRYDFSADDTQIPTFIIQPVPKLLPVTLLLFTILYFMFFGINLPQWLPWKCSYREYGLKMKSALPIMGVLGSVLGFASYLACVLYFEKLCQDANEVSGIKGMGLEASLKSSRGVGTAAWVAAIVVAIIESYRYVAKKEDAAKEAGK